MQSSNLPTTIPPAYLGYTPIAPDLLRSALTDAISTGNGPESRATLTASALLAINKNWQSALTYAVTLPQMSRTFIANLRAAALRGRVDLPRSITSMICIKCSSVLIPGVTCSVKTRAASKIAPVRIISRRPKSLRSKKKDSGDSNSSAAEYESKHANNVVQKDSALKQQQQRQQQQESSGNHTSSVMKATSSGPSKLSFASPFSMEMLSPKMMAPLSSKASVTKEASQGKKEGGKNNKYPESSPSSSASLTQSSPKGKVDTMANNRTLSQKEQAKTNAETTVEYRRVHNDDRHISWTELVQTCHACGHTEKIADGITRGTVTTETRNWHNTNQHQSSGKKPVDSTHKEKLQSVSNPPPLIRLGGKRTRASLRGSSINEVSVPSVSSSSILSEISKKLKTGDLRKELKGCSFKVIPIEPESRVHDDDKDIDSKTDQQGLNEAHIGVQPSVKTTPRKGEMEKKLEKELSRNCKKDESFAKTRLSSKFPYNQAVLEEPNSATWSSPSVHSPNQRTIGGQASNLDRGNKSDHRQNVFQNRNQGKDKSAADKLRTLALSSGSRKFF